MRRIRWAIAAGLAGWAAARLTGADRLRALEAPVAPLLSFTPHVAAAAPLGWLLVRKRAPASAAVTTPRARAALAGMALAEAALAAVVLPRAVRRPQPRARGPVLRVLTANLLVGRASEESVVDLVWRTRTDVLFVQELTDDAVRRFKQAGLNDVLPYDVTDARGEGSYGAGIFARFPLSDGLSLTPIPVAQPTARLQLPTGQRLDLVCVHPHPPTPPSSRRVATWREELAVLPPPGEPPRVLAGDFNATLDHAQFRRLLRLGHVDAADQVGHGLIATWGPAGKIALLTLDHVVVDPRCAVLATSVHRLPGSDHRAVLAEFRLPGR